MCWPPCALVGSHLFFQAGPLWVSEWVAPWALVGRALMGLPGPFLGRALVCPWGPCGFQAPGPYGQSPCRARPPGPLWVWLVWASLGPYQLGPSGHMHIHLEIVSIYNLVYINV